MSKAFRWCLVLGSALVLAAAPQAGERPAARPLLVAAAASLSGVAPQLSRAARDEATLDLRFTFAASNTLARQIVEGARVDVFISADEAQMDVVERAGRLVPGTRANVIGNQLVLISANAGTLAPDDLAAPEIRRIAMGDPAAVPAGVYGRRWLERIGLWDAVMPKVIPLPSAPAVVVAVQQGRADAGIVYATDARTHDHPAAHRVPPADAPPIVYPAAAIEGGRTAEARTFLEFLQGSAARRVFEAAGFLPLD